MAELSLTFPVISTAGGSNALVGAGTVTVISGSVITTISGSGIDLPTHENIDSLVHGISEDTYSEIIRNANNEVIEVNLYQSFGGPLVRKTEITRDLTGTVTSTVERQYDSSGTLIQSLTTTLVRDGNGAVVTITTNEVP